MSVAYPFRSSNAVLSNCDIVFFLVHSSSLHSLLLRFVGVFCPWRVKKFHCLLRVLENVVLIFVLKSFREIIFISFAIQFVFRFVTVIRLNKRDGKRIKHPEKHDVFTR